MVTSPPVTVRAVACALTLTPSSRLSRACLAQRRRRRRPPRCSRKQAVVEEETASTRKAKNGEGDEGRGAQGAGLLFNVPLLNVTTSFVAEQQATDDGFSGTREVLLRIWLPRSPEELTPNRKFLPAVSTSLALAAGIGLMETVALIFGSGTLMDMIGIPIDSPMRIPAEQFLTFRAYGAPPIVVALAAQGAFRGLMDTKTPLYAVVWLTISLLNDALALVGKALLASEYAKRNYKQARLVLYRVLQIGGVTGLALAVALFFGFGSFSVLFTNDPAVLDIAKSGVWFVTISQPINAIAFMIGGLYYGVSDFAYAAYSMVREQRWTMEAHLVRY
ncbi:unnamed protein product [Miscanthus lutarioriparius]|uniref:Protein DETOXIFICATION n=1 Tax=Miscanthus lutarioriparius TaxID=422564 RepID=A0A811RGZ3_9POAL|nr:unnamed protein product [Miscanthus lutarioriparius]